MRVFSCGNCGQAVYFENVSCENCGMALGFDPHILAMRTLNAKEENGRLFTASSGGGQKTYCANYDNNVCNWLVTANEAGGLCLSCGLNNTIPDLSIIENLERWFEIEKAKRRLIYTLLKLGLPLLPGEGSTVTPLAFNILADAQTGHENGLITINIAEADPAKRERTREQMNEPYRTLLGHFRHEIGHYYWLMLVANGPIDQFRELFGDERVDYQAELAAYHQNGPKADWPESYISAYATAHPWEDWAESFAHYLHIVDTLETAEDYRVESRLPRQKHMKLPWFASRDPFRARSASQLVDRWLPLALAMNSLNRSMGLPDFYPFVIPPAAIGKLDYIHQLVQKA